MRVGVNTLFLIPSEVGGTETYLCQTLRAIAQHHSDVRLVLFNNAENDAVLRERLVGFDQLEHVNLDFRASNRYSRIIREQVQLPGLVRRAGVDVLWSPGYTAPFFSPCPQVVTIHDMQYKRYPRDFPLINLLVTDILVRVAARGCRRIIAVSEFSKSEIVSFAGARPEVVDVTPEAANPIFGKKVAADERRRALDKLGLANKPYILCVSNSYPHKNMHALVDAFGELTAEIPHQLVIIGRPRLGEPALRASMGKLSDKSRVSRFDYVAYEDLPAIYQGAAVFVFPSLYEGFGLPVLEAMMAGIPVVTTREASIPELGGDCVAYCGGRDSHELAARIRDTLAMDQGGKRSLCDKAAARAGSFSWKSTADKTVECLKKAATSGSINFNKSL